MKDFLSALLARFVDLMFLSIGGYIIWSKTQDVWWTVLPWPFVFYLELASWRDRRDP